MTLRLSPRFIAPLALAFVACVAEAPKAGVAPTPAVVEDAAAPPPTPDVLPLCAPADTFGDARIDALARSLETLDACPTRSWSGWSWHDLQAVFVSQKAKKAYVWNDRALACRGFHELDFASLPPDVAASDYFFPFEREGAPAVSVSLDTTALLNRQTKGYSDQALTLAVHEGFHFVPQLDWSLATVGDRDPAYPDVWRLRHLRRELGRSLLAVLEEGAPLENAAYWQGQLTQAYPEDLAQLGASDVYEGSAQYASSTAEVLAKLGCAATDDDVRAEVVANGRAFFPDITDGTLDAVSEPYGIGLLASLIAARGDAPAFHAKVAGGTTPVDALLAGVKAAAVTEDAARRDQARKTVEASNAEAGSWIDPLLARLGDVAAVRLVVREHWSVDAFSLSGSFRLVEQPGEPSAVRNLSSRLRDPRSGVAVQIANADVLSTTSTPCGGDDHVYVVPVAAGDAVVDAAAQRVTVAAPSVTTTALPAVERRDAAGLVWLCPTP